MYISLYLFLIGFSVCQGVHGILIALFTRGGGVGPPKGGGIMGLTADVAEADEPVLWKPGVLRLQILSGSRGMAHAGLV